MNLRPYQQQAVAAVQRDWTRHTDVLGVAATGAGKTQILLTLMMDALDADPHARGLVIAHRTELVDQPIERIRQFRPDWLMADSLARPRVGVIQAERDDCDRQLTFATVQSLRGKRLARMLAHGAIDYLVTDEAHHCHVPGTLVATPHGRKAIEEITIGDSVYGWNGVSFDCYAVDNTFAYWYDGPIREIHTASGRMVRVTPNHKLYSEGRRIYASELQQGQTLSLPAMQLGNRQRTSHSAASAVVTSWNETLPGMLPRNADNRAAGTHRGASNRADRMSRMWTTDAQTGTGRTHQHGASWGGILTSAASEGNAEAWSEYGLSAGHFQAHDRPQPNGSARCQGQDDRQDAPASRIRQDQGIRWASLREWCGDDASGTSGDDAVSKRNTAARGRIGRWTTPGALQDRCGMAEIENRLGIGRLIASAARPTGDGSAQGSAPQSHRMDDRSCAESGCALREDRIVAVTTRHYAGLVYDFEVRDVHNYVANGILSSNSVSPTYLELLEALRAANPDMRHLGVTATPIRADGDGLARVYQKTSFRVTIADLVKLGYLVQPRWLGIATGISVAGVQTRQGDFAPGELARRFDTEHGRQIIIEAYQHYAAGRQGIAFTASVAGAHDLADEFRAGGVSAAAIDASTPKDQRRRLLADFRAGRLDLLCNVDVLTEGFDAPGASCILMCRPTRSDGRYVQCMGRGLRPAMGMAQPGEDCLILDFLPAETRNIVMAGDVLGLPKETTRPVLNEQAVEPGAVQAGFTFDGETFDSNGTPLEIISRELHYLEQSPFTWHRRDGLLTLGLGPGNDRIERMLAIKDGVLYAIWRRVAVDNERRAPWECSPIACDDPFVKGQELAEKNASQQLAAKGRAWQHAPASLSQQDYLRKLAHGALSRRELETITRGQAAQLITHYQVRQVINRYERGC